MERTRCGFREYGKGITGGSINIDEFLLFAV